MVARSLLVESEGEDFLDVSVLQVDICICHHLFAFLLEQ